MKAKLVLSLNRYRFDSHGEALIVATSLIHVRRGPSRQILILKLLELNCRYSPWLPLFITCYPKRFEVFVTFGSVLQPFLNK